MTILVLGKNGQVGYELEHALQPLGALICRGSTELSLADESALRHAVRDLQPHVIVNAGAYTDVDKAETETDKAHAINARGPAVLAEEAEKTNALLVHYSTDYVFDGQKTTPYTESDAVAPLGAYGATKLAGEQAILATNAAALVLRTSWVYSTRRDSFVTKVLKWARAKPLLRIAADQFGGPTWCRSLARGTADLIRSLGDNPGGTLQDRRGIYHCANVGGTSRYEWAKATLLYDPKRHEQVVQEIQPAAAADFPAPARRPNYSVLDCTKLRTTFGVELPSWEPTLMQALTANGTPG